MRRFLASAWFPFVISLVFAGACVGAYAILPVLENDVSNSQLLMVFAIAEWAIGPVVALLSWLLMMLLNGIRRMVRLRKVALLHPVVVLLGLCPWCIFSYQLLFHEPRYTPFAVLMIDNIGRQLFVGSFVACILTLLLSIPLLFRPKK